MNGKCDRMKLMSWNINGIRAAYRNGFLKTLKEADCDVVLLQEVKAEKTQIPEEIHHTGYGMDVFSADKKGYSGTMALFRTKPLSISKGTGHALSDSEGRVQTLEYEDFYLVNTYFPNSQHGLARLGYKLEFDSMIHEYCNSLRKTKPVVMCGDFNVAHTEIDIARPDENRNNPGFTDQERDWMTSFLGDSYVDTYRVFQNSGGHYSWWSYRMNARDRNIGWRIDYFIISDGLKGNLSSADILEGEPGSDHAPVTLELDF